MEAPEVEVVIPEALYADGEYVATIQVLNRYSTEDSMCASFIPQEAVPMVVEDGKIMLFK